MLIDYPTPLATWGDRAVAVGAKRTARVVASDSWRYEGRRSSRVVLVLAAVISATMHASLFFGSVLLPKKPLPRASFAEAPVIRLALPELKEIEEPESSPGDEPPPPADLAVPVPMQSDVPSLPAPSDFVQPLNFASLLEAPDLGNARLTVIPETYLRSTRLAESIGKIFSLEDLDRTPVPVLQPSPTYPVSMRREGLSATVMVQFVVDTDGRVLDPVVVDSTHSGFNDAAVAGVARWKFRAGMRNGKKVNVRMQVPLHFQMVETLDP